MDEWPANGPHALFLHGNGITRGVWRPIARAVAGHCHAVALDLRGHGGAAKPEGEYRWPSLADDVIATMEGEGWTPALMVGHSLGGAVAIDIAARRPDLILGIVIFEPVLSAKPVPHDADRIVQMFEGARNRRSTWATREEAAAYLRERAIYTDWDDEVFAGFIDTGLVETADGVELACPPEIEARIYTAEQVQEPFLQLSEVQRPVWYAYSIPAGMGMDTVEGALERTPTITGYPSDGSGHFLPHVRPEWAASVIEDALDAIEDA